MQRFRPHHYLGMAALAGVGFLATHQFVTVPAAERARAALPAAVATSGRIGATVDTMAEIIIRMGAAESSGNFSEATRIAQEGGAAAEQLAALGAALTSSRVGSDELAQALHDHGRSAAALAMSSAAMFDAYASAYASGSVAGLTVDVGRIRAELKQVTDLHDRVEAFND